MNSVLIRYIANNLEEGARFVTHYMPIDIDSGAAYEALLMCSRVYSPDMVKAFEAAVKYLPPVPSYKRRSIKLPNGKTASLNPQLSPTSKWPQFLFPEGELVITPESKLYALLTLPLKVAQDWTMLRFVWTRLAPQDTLSVPVLAHFFPWLREIVTDFPFQDYSTKKNDGNYLSSVDRDIIKREIATIMRANPPAFFPSKTPQLTSVMRSGRALMGQYRMLSSAHAEHGGETACLQVDATDSLVPDWVSVSLTTMLEQWEIDKRHRIERALNKTIHKASAKFDRNSGE